MVGAVSLSIGFDRGKGDEPVVSLLPLCVNRLTHHLIISLVWDDLCD